MISKYTAILLLSTVSVPALAGDVSQQGADEIKNTLTKYLPKDMVDTGFLTVRPAGTVNGAVTPPVPGDVIVPPSGSDQNQAAGNRYELIIDVEPLLAKFKQQEFSISGLKPFINYLTPLDDGLWRIESNQNLDVTAQFKVGEQTAQMSYSIENMAGDGLFDPSISYFREAKWSASGGKLHSATGTDVVDMTFGSIEQVVQTTQTDDARVTITATATVADLAETIKSSSSGNVSINAGGASADIRFENFNIGAFRDLIIFVLDRIHQDQLTAEDGEKLRSILRANLPFGDKFEETLGVRDLKIEGQGMTALIGEADYSFDFNGIRSNSAVGFGFTAGGLSLPPGVLPPGSEEALPDKFSIGFVLTDLNLDGAATYFLDHADLTSKEFLTPTESQQISRIISPDGKLHLELRNVFAKSAHYDIEMVGSGIFEADRSDRGTADVTIYARNLDATIAFLQSKASTIPEFGQASFGAQMMKGFAKKEADGRYSWNIVVGEGGSVKINGQEMPR